MLLVLLILLTFVFILIEFVWSQPYPPTILGTGVAEESVYIGVDLLLVLYASFATYIVLIDGAIVRVSQDKIFGEHF